LREFEILEKVAASSIGFEHGADVSNEGKSAGFTQCFVVTFRDEKGLETYVEHPAHHEYVQVARDKREKVVLFDASSYRT